MPYTFRPSFSTQLAPAPGNGETTTSVTTKCRGRSSSFTNALKRLLPTNKPERGGTIRTHGVHYSSLDLEHSPSARSKSVPAAPYPTSPKPSSTPEKLVRWNATNGLVVHPPTIITTATTTTSGYPSTSSPSTRSQKIYLARREARRQRRSLKESGDYLGVQGLNPVTGEMDVLTPTTGSTATSSSSSPFNALTREVQDKRAAYEGARRALRSEKVRKWEMDKEALQTERRRKVRWTRRAEGWNSAVEPELSPIAGSSPACSTPRVADVSGDTVVRTACERSTTEGGTVEGSVSTVRPVLRVSGSMNMGACSIRRKPVPIRSQTLSSRRSYSDLIPVESEFPAPPPRPPKIAIPPIPPKIALTAGG